MPVPKRYFHCSQDINTDAELWEFTDKFGDRALRLWLQILSVLDRTQNAMPLAGQWLPQLATTVNMNTKTVLVALMWIINRKWLIPSVITDGDSPETGRKLVEDFFETCRKLVEDWPKTHRRLSVNSSDASHKHIEELSEIGRKLVLRSPNWSKYNRTREHKWSGKSTLQGTQKERIDTPSFPTPTPTPTPTPKKEEKKPLRADDEWMESLQKNPAYTHINLTVENGKMDEWLRLPKNKHRIKTRSFVLNWLNKIERPLSVPYQSQPCQERVKRENFLKPCGAPSVEVMNGRPLCKEHYEQRRNHAASA